MLSKFMPLNLFLLKRLNHLVSLYTKQYIAVKIVINFTFYLFTLINMCKMLIAVMTRNGFT